MDPKFASYLITKFAAQFLDVLEKKNNASSGLATEVLLALLTISSENQAHSELLTAMNFPDDDAIRSAFAFLRTKFDNVRNITLRVVNRIYMEMGEYKLKPRVKKNADEIYRGMIEQMYFGHSEIAADIINAWVTDHTDLKIPQIISAKEIEENKEGLLLLNAVYFYGTWKKGFRSDWVKNWPFYVDNQTRITVPMMSMGENSFLYGESEELEAKLLRMDYTGDDASMVIVLPDLVEGLDGVIKKIALGHDLAAEMENMSYIELEIAIPTFRIETDIDLSAVLPELGIKAIFVKDSKDIKLLDGTEGTYVSLARQRAIIEVDDVGREVVDETEKILSLEETSSVHKSFIAWRPFLYMVMMSNTVLFMGTFRGKQ